jgi:hypothetical protein
MTPFFRSVSDIPACSIECFGSIFRCGCGFVLCGGSDVTCRGANIISYGFNGATRLFRTCRDLVIRIVNATLYVVPDGFAGLADLILSFFGTCRNTEGQDNAQWSGQACFHVSSFRDNIQS